MTKKFCGRCGAPLRDNAKVCGRCGFPVGSGGPTNDRPRPTGNVAVQKKKTQKIVLVVFCVLIAIVMAAVIFGAVWNRTGYRGIVREIMQAYESYDVDTMLDRASELYYIVGESDAVDYFESVMSTGLDEFEDRLGYDYELSYEVLDANILSDRRLQAVLDDLQNSSTDFDPDVIEEIMLVEVELSGQGKRDYTVSKQIYLYLSNEYDEWRLLNLSYSR